MWPVASFWQCRLSEVFGWDLEKFLQKGVTSYTFCFSADYLKFWIGLRKESTKICAQLHVLSAVETILSFWWDLENFSQKSVPSYTFCSLWRLSQVFDGFWKNFHKKVCPVTRFVLCGDYLKFLMGLRKISTKKCAQLHVLFAVETILSFGWDLESFDKKVWPVTHFFCSTDYLKFSMVLRKVSTKRCDQLHGFNAVESNLSFWWDLESFDKKLWPVAPFWQYRLSQVFDGT